MNKNHFAPVYIGFTISMLGFYGSAHASVTQTVSYSGTVAGLPVSNTDLLQTNLSSIAVTGSFNSNAQNNYPDLVDGSLGTAGQISFPGALGCVGPTTGATLTFNFNLSSSPSGYDIYGISTFASWNQNRDGQEYSVLYSTYLAPTTFSPFYSITAFDPFSLSNPSTTGVNLTDSGAGVPMLTNVAAIKFSFDGPSLSGAESGYTMYREIDIVGQPATAPEPATLALIAMGGIGLTIRLRRRTSLA